MKEKMNSIKIKAMKLYARTSGILADNRGEGYIDTARCHIDIGGAWCFTAGRIIRFIWRRCAA